METDAPAMPDLVRRRHVFYVSGFDPQGPARYHAMYAAEAAKQSAVNGMRIDVGRRRNAGTERSWWPVHAVDRGHIVETHYEFLRWDDIVRAEWPRDRWVQLLQSFRTPWHYLRNGALRRLFAVYPVSVYLMIAPALLVLGVVACSALFAVLLFAWDRAGYGAAVLWLVGTALAVWGAWHLENRLQLAWLMRSYAFTTRHADGRVPAIEARLDAFGQRIAEVIDEGAVDEVLVVGHSSGAQMAVSAVARAEQRLAADAKRPALGLMTVGHCVPILSFLPAATTFREDLRRTANATSWCWTDFTAPADGCSFVLIDPTVQCEGVPGAHADRPKVLSPRFASMFSAAAYAPLRRDKMRYHFQYLMASERPGAYDYFLVTAGAMRLADRFGALRSIAGDHGARGRPG